MAVPDAEAGSFARQRLPDVRSGSVLVMDRAASSSPTIRDFSTTRSQTVKVGRQLLTYQNTNPLVRDPKWDISVQKTGHVSEAEQCLVLQVEIGGRPAKSTAST